jgi:hypothetical protein
LTCSTACRHWCPPYLPMRMAWSRPIRMPLPRPPWLRRPRVPVERAVPGLALAAVAPALVIPRRLKKFGPCCRGRRRTRPDRSTSGRPTRQSVRTGDITSAPERRHAARGLRSIRRVVSRRLLVPSRSSRHAEPRQLPHKSAACTLTVSSIRRRRQQGVGRHTNSVAGTAEVHWVHGTASSA